MDYRSPAAENHSRKGRTDRTTAVSLPQLCRYCYKGAAPARPRNLADDKRNPPEWFRHELRRPARGRAGAGLLAHIVVSKYDDHLPLYRQAEIFARDGVGLETSTLSGANSSTFMPPPAHPSPKKRSIALASFFSATLSTHGQFRRIGPK